MGSCCQRIWRTVQWGLNWWVLAAIRCKLHAGANRLLSMWRTPPSTSRAVAPVHTHDFADDYSITRVLGAGASGSVHEAQSKGTGALVAAKAVLRESVQSAFDHAALVQEMRILARLRHCNIIELNAIYDCPTDKSYWILMELATGGEVFQDGEMSEDAVKHVIKSVAEALQYLHESCGIIHRDVKPQNIMYDSPFTKAVKLVDFGISSVRDQTSPKGLHRAFTVIGSYPYMAPELTHAGYGSKVDIWALGVVMYMLCCGEHPFGPEDYMLTERAMEGSFSFDVDEESGPWEASLVDCCKQMLQVDPRERLTAAALLSHPWICSKEPECAAMSARNKSGVARRTAAIARLRSSHAEKRNSWFKNTAHKKVL